MRQLRCWTWAPKSDRRHPSTRRVAGDDSPLARHCSTRGDLGAAVGHAVNRASVVVRDEQRTILHDLHVHWPSAVFVVLKEAGEKRLLRSYAAVLVQLYDDDIAADLPRAVP